MDAFYASVEQHDDPSLKGKPVIVGSKSRRGVVAAASYEVRKFGVYSAMSSVEAQSRCPHAVFVSPRMDRYQEVSEQIFEVFHEFTPDVEGLSVDEAFLDVTGSQTLFGSSVEIAKLIKARIRERTGLNASAGVAPNKFVAKVASDLDKPDGLVIVAPESVREFLAPLKIERIWGVGPKAAKRLHAHGFHTMGDIASASPGQVHSILGERVFELSQGIDNRHVVSSRSAKSIGAEHTFDKDLKDPDELKRHILGQCQRVAQSLTRKQLWARTVTLKIKYGNHQSQTKQRSLDAPCQDTDSLYRVACDLLPRFDLKRGVRLTGISAAGLTNEPAPTLFPDERQKRSETLEALTLSLRDRFGKEAIHRAGLLDPPEVEEN